MTRLVLRLRLALRVSPVHRPSRPLPALRRRPEAGAVRRPAEALRAQGPSRNRAEAHPHLPPHAVAGGQARGIPMKYPPGHPFNSLHALRLAIAFGGTYDTSRRSSTSSGPRAARRTTNGKRSATRSASPARKCSPRATAVKTQLRDNTDEAIRAGVFGVPTFVVDDHLFWGARRDRDAARLSRQPAALRLRRDEAPARPPSPPRADATATPLEVEGRDPSST